ncbi:MAG: class I SAM-dependent methyltransferase [Elusimicrobia bacterium]|nr:class I SAM-dependent methyltransferase [Elusimicrobiota bacterium]
METVSCALCGSAAFSAALTGKDRDWGSGDVFTIVKCDGCGLAFVNPRPDKNELGKYYPAENWSRARNRVPESDAIISGAPWTAAAAERAGAIIRLGRKGRILDVGCGDGFLLLYLARAGWDCYGVEPGGVAAAYAREVLSLKVSTGMFEKGAYPAGFFSVVNFHHVFEHLSDPAGALEEVSRLLDKDGCLVISVPNFDSFDRRLFGNKWVGLKLPQHLFHYTRHTLGAFLEKAGFEVREVGYRSYEAADTMYYSESVRHCLQDLGLYPLKQEPSGGEPGPAAPAAEKKPLWKASAHFAERLFFKSVGFAADRLGLGSGMTVVARKHGH